MIQKIILIIILLLFSISFYVSSQIAVHYRCGETDLESPMIKPHINIINKGDTSVELKDIKIRYFYSKEGNADERFQVEYAVVGGAFIKVTFEYGYFEISFPEADMVIPANGGATGEIQLKIYKQDWSNYDQSDDFSFNPTFSEFGEFGRIALYYQDAVYWGTEHYLGPSPTPLVPKKE